MRYASFMNTRILWGIVIIIIFISGGYWYTTQKDSVMDSAGMGTYAYMCDNGSEFSMAPASDMSEVTLTAGSQGMFTGTMRLAKMGDAAHYETVEGQLIVLSGAGEEVQLTVGEETTTCNPVPNSDMAPWNWGDAGEGAGSIQPDVSVVVSESIQGRWQSTQDPKSVRVFNDDYTVEDIYDGETVSTGLWVAFTKMNAPEIAFPLEDSAVYLQITEEGTVLDTLTFKVTRITPDELELIYMGRGGALTYTRVQ